MTRRRTRSVPGIGVAVLLSPSLLAAQEASGGGSALFSLNLGLLIWTWVLFLLTLGILAWKVFPFIAGGLEERQRKIQESIDAAHRAREEAARHLAERQEELEAARREALALVEKAREVGERLREEILAEARRDQEELVERTRAELERERQELVEQVRREAVDVSLAAAERLLRTKLDSEENRRLISDYVSRLE
ncbi:MAG: F0F1 ATP synthase subunit B [Gemmatimonadota bacterium]